MSVLRHCFAQRLALAWVSRQADGLAVADPVPAPSLPVPWCRVKPWKNGWRASRHQFQTTVYPCFQLLAPCLALPYLLFTPSSCSEPPLCSNLRWPRHTESLDWLASLPFGPELGSYQLFCYCSHFPGQLQVWAKSI